MAVYWVTTALPLTVTALIPLFAFPLARVVTTSVVIDFYVTETSFVFVGGLIIAIAIEQSNLHRRLAMSIIIKVGESPRRLMAGIMLTTMILSLWISNTAATAVMITVVEGILEVISEDNKPNVKVKEEDVINMHNSERNFGSASPISGNDNNIEDNSLENTSVASINLKDSADGNVKSEKLRKLTYGYYLSILYAANIGGTGVLTGTAPNLVVIGVLSEAFTEPTGVNFTSWMMLNIPGMVICLLFSWMWLQYRYVEFGKSSLDVINPDESRISGYVQEQYENLGPLTYQEKVVSLLFSLLIPLWVFRDPGFIYGWGKMIEDAYGENLTIGDSVPVILIIFIAFVLPSKNPLQFEKVNGVHSFPHSEGILTWKQIQDKVPWGLAILFGGGIAISKASSVSGLSTWVGQQLRRLNFISPPVLLISLTVITACITELMSNTATTSIVLPVFKELSLEICTNPLYFMIPAAVSSSFAFMLPVATAANALIYQSSGIPYGEMVKSGFIMNVICIVIENAIVNTLGVAVFDVHNMPAWANSSTSGTLPNC